MNPESGRSSSDAENFGGYSFEPNKTGIYVPKEKQSSKQNPDAEEPQVPSQNEVDLSQYEEVFVVDPEEAAKRYMETGQTSPLVTVRKKQETATGTPQQRADAIPQQETATGTPQQGADAIPQQETATETSQQVADAIPQPQTTQETPTSQENEDDIRYRKALNSVQNGDRTRIAEDKKRTEKGDSVTTIMEDDEAKRLEATLQDIEPRNQQPRLTKLEQSLQRDKAERQQREAERQQREAERQQKEAEETAEKERKHQEALDQNTQRNEGFKPGPASDGLRDGLRRMEEGAARAIEERQQLEKQIAGIPNRLRQTDPGLSHDITYALEDKDVQAAMAKVIEDRNRRHQTELRRHDKLNEGFKPGPASDGLRDGLRRMEEDAAKAIRENEEFEKNFTYINEANKRVEIPLPIREEMALMFGDGTQVLDPKTAERFGVMENDLYNQRYNEKVEELRNRGFDDATIDAYMKIAQYEIKTDIQEDVRTMVTNELHQKVIDRIEQDPEKYKDFIDPTTGQVKESLKGDISLILEQKIFSQWMQGEQQNRGEETPTPEVIDDTTPEVVDDTTPEAVDDTTPEAVDDTTPEAVDTPPEEVTEETTTTHEDSTSEDTPSEEEPTRPDTPEERLTRLNNRIDELTDKTRDNTLTPEEALELAQLIAERDDLQKTLAEEEDAEAEKRKKKNRWIKIIAGVAGAGIALATPAVSAAALIAVTFGGRLIGKGLEKWGENLRRKSSEMQYQLKDGMTPEEIEELEKRQRRNKWWGERLSEISSIIVGGTTGYGLGKALQNIIEIVKATQGQVPTTPEQPPVDNVGDQPAFEGGEPGAGTPEDLFGDMPKVPETETSWLGDAKFWDTSKFGWDPNKYGWNSSNIALEGSTYGDLQGSLLRSISQKVPESAFYKKGAQDLLQRAFAIIYQNGAGSVEAASNTFVEGIQALP